MNDRQELLNSLLRLAEKEKKKGNTSITPEKLDKLNTYISNHNKSLTKYTNIYPVLNNQSTDIVPTPKKVTRQHSLFFDKFELPENRRPPIKKLIKTSKLKRFETRLINILETIANILDNLYLFSKLPMFPEKLLGLLKHTNKLWLLLLIFLIRKTVSQLINVIRKERKVKIELNILQSSAKTEIENQVTRKYHKVLKDLKFDKTMLILELIGNFLDFGFNVIEFFGLLVPEWVMNTLNVTSMMMSIYRMNKDDEYIDDDITEDLI